MSKLRRERCPECRAGRPCPMAGTKLACPPDPRAEPWRFEGGAAGERKSAAERTLPLFKDRPENVPPKETEEP